MEKIGFTVSAGCNVSVKTFSLLLLLLSRPLFAQDISFDRPGIAESPFTVTDSAVQFEAGNELFSPKLLINTWQLPSLLIRSGLTSNLEIRYTYDYALLNEYSVRRLEQNTGILHALGIKYRLYEGKKNFSASLLSTLSASFSDLNKAPGTDILFIAHHGWGRYSLNYNIGYTSPGNFEPGFHLAVCNGFEWKKRLHYFIEPYLYIFGNWKNYPGLNGGLVYFPVPEIQADLSGGIFGSDEAYYFVSFGLSYHLRYK